MSEEQQDQALEANPAELEQSIDDATEAVQVQSRELDELAADDATGQPIGLDNLMTVPVQVTVQVGCTRLSLSELVAMRPGSLITLDREAHDPADILVNGKVVARGEVVTIGEKYGVRITQVE